MNQASELTFLFFLKHLFTVCITLCESSADCFFNSGRQDYVFLLPAINFAFFAKLTVAVI